MNWLSQVFGWLAGFVSVGAPGTGSDRREDFNTFTAEMWRYVERLGADYEKRLAELTAFYEKRLSDLQADYEKRLNDLTANYEQRLSELTAKHEGAK